MPCRIARPPEGNAARRTPGAAEPADVTPKERRAGGGGADAPLGGGQALAPPPAW